MELIPLGTILSTQAVGQALGLSPETMELIRAATTALVDYKLLDELTQRPTPPSAATLGPLAPAVAPLALPTFARVPGIGQAQVSPLPALFPVGVIPPEVLRLLLRR